MAWLYQRGSKVVAPSLTPIGYNPFTNTSTKGVVVAPSLTPIGYNGLFGLNSNKRVVAPSLTPIGYNVSHTHL